MVLTPDDCLRIRKSMKFDDATLVLAFSGWMDGGDVSTGTVSRLIDLLDAEPIADIDSEPFYIYNFPGSMEVAALFRPHIEIEDGLVKACEMPTNVFYANRESNIVLFVGKEPNLQWRAFGDHIFHFAEMVGATRILFVGSFGGAVPHTRQPRLYVTVSDEGLLSEFEKYGVGRTGYEGPGSFMTYLMTRATEQSIEMVSLVAEIPGYLQGANPVSIEAVTRRLATILHVPGIDLDSLRTASTEWELQISTAVEEDDDMAAQVRRLEEQYDDELLESDSDDE